MQALAIIEQADQHGDRIAIKNQNASHSYRDLITQSHIVASHLLDQRKDLQEKRVAFLEPTGRDYIIAQWGIWRAGGIAIPLSHSATERELEYTLNDSGSEIVVTTSEGLPRIASLINRHNLHVVISDELNSAVQADLPEINPHRRAMILYTSGTTSQPKGVVSTHENIQAQIQSLVTAWRWGPEDCIPLFLPLHHIHGIINIMSCALWSGATIEPYPRFDLERVLQRVGEDAYSVFMAVPTIYAKLIQHLRGLSSADRQLITDAFRRMRLMVSGSAALPALMHEEWTDLTGQKLLERYGMTEIGMALANPYDGERRPGFVGQPLPGVKVKLISEAGDEIAEENQSGEILVSGPGVFKEYWNRSKVSQESFIDGWFRTGDTAIVEDGYYRIMGRSSIDIIKSGGYKLSALEIEALLLEHPEIRECAVVGLPDEVWGQTVAAAVVLENATALDLDQLSVWCTERLSGYKIPRKLLCVDQLPRNAMGKVTKPAVVSLFET